MEISRYSKNLNKKLKDVFHIESKPVEEGKYMSSYDGYFLDNKDKKITVKGIATNFLSKNELQQIKEKVKSMCKVSHPNVQKYYGLYEHKHKLSIVGEKIEDKTLCHQVLLGQSYDEKQIKGILKQLAEALKYLHKVDIFHLNIRPENICLSADEHIKIIDFELSKVSVEQVNIRKKGKQSFFTAPEFFMDDCNKKSDVWSLGALAYYLCADTLPMSEDTYLSKCTRKEYKSGVVNSTDLDNISSDLIDMLKKVLQFDSKLRFSVQQVLSHTWFDAQWEESTMDDSSKTVSEVNDRCSKVTLKRLKDFSLKPTLQKVLLFLLVTSSGKYETSEIEAEFLKIDRNSNGLIDHIDLMNAYTSCGASISEIKSITQLGNISISGDKKIHFTEFLVATKSHKFLKSENLKSLFSKLDSMSLSFIDETNILTQLKIQGLSINSKDLSENMKSYECYSKGFLDYDEYENICVAKL